MAAEIPANLTYTVTLRDNVDLDSINMSSHIDHIELILEDRFGDIQFKNSKVNIYTCNKTITIDILVDFLYEKLTVKNIDISFILSTD